MFLIGVGRTGLLHRHNIVLTLRVWPDVPVIRKLDDILARQPKMT